MTDLFMIIHNKQQWGPGVTDEKDDFDNLQHCQSHFEA